MRGQLGLHQCRATSDDASDLTAYLDTLKGKPVDSWTSAYEKFTPRRTFGPGQKGDIYWGENCEYIRHFDCIGFISFCIWKTTGAVHQREIKQWANLSGSTAKSYVLAERKPSELMDGDILVRTVGHEHIAFVSKDGQILQANDTDKGVTDSSRFNLATPGNWSHLVRLA